jgi:glycosyltransferase involved in cell wall biosynthesis|tara:strand:- start:524 stop:1375 length:852 start_codon:yes stop_codon:yes gene_type:complete
MEAKPKISIIINCFNGERFIKGCIASVLKQSYTEWEVIFWDNLSTDRSAFILKKFNDKRIKYFKAKKHSNLPMARNLAISKASENLIAFLDIDDLWDEDKLSIQIEAIRRHPDFSFCFTETRVLSESYKKKRRSLKEIFKKKITNSLRDKLLFSNFIFFSSVLINKSILLNDNIFNGMYHQAEDYDLLLRISKNNKIIHVKKILTSYRIHSNNLTNKQYSKNFTESIDILKNYDDERFSFLGQSFCCLMLFIYHLKKLDLKESIKQLISCILFFARFGITYVH